MPLALLRVALGVLILLSPEPTQTRNLVGGSSALLLAPPGLEWLPPVLRWLSPHLPVLHWVLNAACVSLIVGFGCHQSLLVVIPLFVLLFGGAQLTGTVTHDMHMLWLLLVLLFSPCGQALSVDAWRKKRSLWLAAPSRHSSVSLWTARILLACVYLFPGLAKLQVMGLSWASSENLLNQMRIKWFLAGGQVPWPRLDEYPLLVGIGGLLVLGFELGFIALVFTRMGRWCAAMMGLAFHFATAHFFYIPFPSLWGCYGVLWNGPQVRHDAQSAITRCEGAAIAVGFALVCGVSIAGFQRQTQAWPFACYPDFSTPVSAHVWDIAVDVHHTDDSVVTLRPPRRRPSHEWGTVWRILGLYDGKPQYRAIEAYAQKLLQRQTQPGTSPRGLVVFAERYSTLPEHYALPPLQRKRVYPPLARTSTRTDSSN